MAAFQRIITFLIVIYTVLSVNAIPLVAGPGRDDADLRKFNSRAFLPVTPMPATGPAVAVSVGVGAAGGAVGTEVLAAWRQWDLDRELHDSDVKHITDIPTNTAEFEYQKYEIRALINIKEKLLRDITGRQLPSPDYLPTPVAGWMEWFSAYSLHRWCLQQTAAVPRNEEQFWNQTSVLLRLIEVKQRLLTLGF